MSDVVRTSVDGAIATITIDRPEALNAINTDVIAGVADAVLGLPAEAQAIVLTGAGDRAFVAGADIAQMVDQTPEESETFSREGQRAFQALADFRGLSIAAINGFALGGGLELAMACDYLIASDKARVGLPEATLGVIPGFGGTQRLPRRVGPAMAKRLMMTGEMVGANDALEMGIVDEVVPAEDLLDRASSLAKATTKTGPIAARECKRLIDEGMEMAIDDAISMEAAAFGEIFRTKDREEGMKAFLEKRKAEFVGE